MTGISLGSSIYLDRTELVVPIQYGTKHPNAHYL
jgi:hypothetical protein